MLPWLRQRHRRHQRVSAVVHALQRRLLLSRTCTRRQQLHKLPQATVVQWPDGVPPGARLSAKTHLGPCKRAKCLYVQLAASHKPIPLLASGMAGSSGAGRRQRRRRGTRYKWCVVYGSVVCYLIMPPPCLVSVANHRSSPLSSLPLRQPHAFPRLHPAPTPARPSL